MTASLDLTPVLAEVWLAVVGMILLMIGVFRGKGSTRAIAALAVASFVVAFLLTLGPANRVAVAGNGLFVVDDFAVFMKALVLIGASLTLIMSDRKSTRLNSSHTDISRMPSSA